MSRLRADPTDQTLLNNLVVALAYQNKIEEAGETFSKIGGQLSESYPAYVHSATAGLLEFRRGNVLGGRVRYHEAERMAPLHKKIRVLIYWAREERHARTDRAAKLAQEVTARADAQLDAHTARLLEVFLRALTCTGFCTGTGMRTREHAWAP